MSAQEQRTEGADDLMASESVDQGRSFDYYDYDYGRYAAPALARRQLYVGKSKLPSKSIKKPASSSSDMLGSFSSLFGSYSGGYHDKCDNGISLGLLLTTLLGIGVMFFALFTKITMGRRKKRSLTSSPAGLEEESDFDVYTLLDKFTDIVNGGKHIHTFTLFYCSSFINPLNNPFPTNTGFT